MKNLSRLLFAMLLVLGYSNVNAQDQNNPWQITIGVNAVDFFPVGEDAPQGDMFAEFFNFGDHWNILPSVSSIAVSKYLSDGFSFGVAGSLNKISKFGDAAVSDLSYYGVDGTIKYNFLEGKTFDPFLGVGGGYTWLEKHDGGGTANAGLGINFWFNNWLGANIASKYKHSFDEDQLLPYFQHNLGITFKFGGIDTDGDGIPDIIDSDDDGDGILDIYDPDPNDANQTETVIDSDDDGVPDIYDPAPDDSSHLITV